jgi:hypothetical protein
MPVSATLRRSAAPTSGPPSATKTNARAPDAPARPGAASAAVAFAPPLVQSALASPGAPLDRPTRAWAEPRFGRGFGDVRVHTGADAAASARAVSAWAYTVGRDVVFADGRYDPGSREGKRLLAHELAHVAQQAGTPDAPAARLEVGAVDAPEEREADRAADAALAGRDARITPRGAPALRRKPGENAKESWDAMARTELDPDEDQRRAPVKDAVDRFLRIPEGAKLMNEVWTLFCNEQECRTSITVRFVDNLPPGDEGASGVTTPEARGAKAYVLYVHYQKDYPSLHKEGRKSEWPIDKPQLVSHTHDPASIMGETLFHEMLHVWFMNARHGKIAWTGHGAKGVEPEFLQRLQTATGQFEELEGIIQVEKEKAERDAQAEEAKRGRASAGPAAPAQPPAGPKPVGFSAGVGLGAGGFTGGRLGFQTVLGADVILNVLGGLRLGVRGLYMTPKGLMLGPSVGYRALQGDGGEPVERPVYFDLDGGLLFELSPMGAERVSKVVSGFGGLGIGQQYPVGGARLWWRLGGMVIITDRKPEAAPGQKAGPVTAGGGGQAGFGATF